MPVVAITYVRWNELRFLKDPLEPLLRFPSLSSTSTGFGRKALVGDSRRLRLEYSGFGPGRTRSDFMFMTSVVRKSVLEPSQIWG